MLTNTIIKTCSTRLTTALRRRSKSNIKGCTTFFVGDGRFAAEKIGFEKELFYAKAVVRGKSVELLLKCIHMNDFGGGADELKAALDTLMKEYGIDDRYAKRLLLVCCDGVSTMG